MEAVLITYLFTMFLISLHLIDVNLDEKHSISLLQLIALRSIGAKGIYYKDWLSFTPVSLIGSGDFLYLEKSLLLQISCLISWIIGIYISKIALLLKVFRA
jgi:hypothetical protein